jgi:hypothetical protein
MLICLFLIIIFHCQKIYNFLFFDFSSVLIVGGLKDQDGRFNSLQDLISKLSRNDTSTDSDDDDDDDLQDFNDLLKSIKWVNTTFNVEAEQPEETGECSIDVIIDKFDHLNEQRLILIQRVKKINCWNIVSAVMVVNLQTGQAQFAIIPVTTGIYENNFQ